jgi:two-component system sensor histidine kinase RegB
MGLFVLASYGVLIYWHAHELVPTHHRLNDFPTHLFTMWIAGAVTAELVAYFVGRASEALARREEALEAMRLRATRSERLVSLTTLAAGTAHELSTPLATIATAARELQRALETRRADEALTDDARLIRSEVDRCQAILDQMSGRAGGSSADEPELVIIPQVLDDVRSRLPADRAGRLVIHAAPDLGPVIVPRAGLSQTLASLIANAFDATANIEAPVVINVSATPDTFRVAISDEGCGLTPEARNRAGEPFFTTKEPGRGLGLGVFLARVFAERLGGSLKLESSIGTTAVLELPTTTYPVQAI